MKSVFIDPGFPSIQTGFIRFNNEHFCNAPAIERKARPWHSYWTNNGTVVSTAASYTFTLTANLNLVANFTVNPVN